MLNKDISTSGLNVLDVIQPDVDLPDFIFTKKFSRYFFFDADFGTSDEHIDVVQEISRLCFDSDFKVNVFSNLDKSYQGSLGADGNWVQSVNEITRHMRDDRDCSGLLMVGGSKQLVLFQKQPVDIGILAIDSDRDLIELSQLINECFFCCKDISNWLGRKTNNDIELVESMGSDFLTELASKYC
ncbi:hypothetical protein [Chitinivorax sp. B]|uniref:hypothetical protein n=1 Tax=Chitinivorax sp. B TaxID=2502235 RepID=UPI0010F551C1|nr:hypothetical protein [Chitinivorax sp. B]